MRPALSEEPTEAIPQNEREEVVGILCLEGPSGRGAYRGTEDTRLRRNGVRDWISSRAASSPPSETLLP
jgi:hypothetical protein